MSEIKCLTRMANAPVYKVTPATLNVIKYQPPLLFPFNFYESAPKTEFSPHPLIFFLIFPKNIRGPELPPRNVYAKFQINWSSRSLFIVQTSVFMNFHAVTLTLVQGH